jgi:hypothetical protein
MVYIGKEHKEILSVDAWTCEANWHLVRASRGECNRGPFLLNLRYALAEFFPPMALPANIDDMSFVEEPVKDRHRGHPIRGEDPDSVRQQTWRY